MSTLTNTQISNTYKGLLKLDDSTTGITSSLQSVQDGLGNDTGIKIATNRLEGGNLFNMYKAGVAQYYGIGLGVSAANPGAGSQNILTTNVFYDNGNVSYSAITVNCSVLEAGTSVDIAFYNSQYLDTYGYVPYQKISTEVNIVTTSTGLKTATFASPLSFSGTGSGYYWMVIKYNTAGTPVLRFQTAAITGVNATSFIPINAGFTYNTAGTAALSAFQTNATVASAVGGVYNTGTFPTTWTSTEFSTITSVAAGQVGFLLHTIK